MRTAIFGILFFLGNALPVAAQTIYVTKTGTKYHKESCYHLKDSKRALALKKAKALNYSACKHCKPIGYSAAEISNSNSAIITKKKSASQCSGKTKAGARCKRKTTASTGRCHQH